MERETVIRMAREAGLRTGGNGNYGVSHITELERFAAAVEANCVPPGWKIIDVGFKTKFPEAPTPTVLIGFDDDDWGSRDEFVKWLRSAAPAPKEES